MQPNRDFVGLPKEFWANIRSISQEVGYTERGKRGQVGPIKVPTAAEIRTALRSIQLSANHLVDDATVTATPTAVGWQVINYFTYRADILNRVVEPLLMNAEQATAVYEELQRTVGATALTPMNKQSGKMKNPAYFTGIINMLVQANLNGLPCNFNPQELTTVTRNREPFRTLSRRIDGAFPSPVDPIAVWEIKEYYYTTTLGSRVADGVYETLLDGMELEEMLCARKALTPADGRYEHLHHLLMVDAYFTWWVKGRSYLCRIIDMLHMGYVDEVLFGREVVERLPEIVKGWVTEYAQRRGVGTR